jgi:hypothetical protein
MNGRRVFTFRNLSVMERMAADGYSSSEIAKAIGSTSSSVRVKCSERKIRLKRGRGRPRQPVANPTAEPTKPTRQVPVAAYMPDSVYAQFQGKARYLKKEPSILVSMLLTAIVNGDLYKAVLDD